LDLSNLRALHLTDKHLTGTHPSGLFTGLKASLARCVEINDIRPLSP
jgi:LRR receptor-like serine/threonine-protein kinase FLS2